MEINEKAIEQSVFKCAVTLLVGGQLTKPESDLEEIILWLEEVVESYREEMKDI